MSDPLVGQEVIGYRLVRRLSVGGMGAVYEAFNESIGRRAAVKVLLPNTDPEDRKRLLAEARAANAIRHPAIIDIFGFGQLSGEREAIVMEFLEGRTLEETLRDTPGRLPLGTSVSVLHQVASALESAHAAGVVHRDLKPGNIFLVRQPDGALQVKVLDFGIAKIHGRRDGPNTNVNVVLGTPTYMAPEQARGERASLAMDLYSLGVIAFELFTGRLPFEHENFAQVMLAHSETPPPVPSQVATGLSPELDAFVLSLLAKEPGARPENASAVVRALEALAQKYPPSSGVKTSRAQPAPQSQSQSSEEPMVVPRSRAPMLVLAGGLLLLVAVIAWSMHDELAVTGGPVASADATDASVLTPKPAPPPREVKAPVELVLPNARPAPKAVMPTLDPAVLESQRGETLRHLKHLARAILNKPKRQRSVTLPDLKPLRDAAERATTLEQLQQVDAQTSALEAQLGR